MTSNGYFPICYFAPISYYYYLLQHPTCYLEMHEHFIKQTYRNRCQILSPNGIQNLSIPIKSVKSRKTYKATKIAYVENWQMMHWRSLEAAYRSSPYFEFYEDEVMQVFHKPYNYLLDLNMEGYEIVSSCLELENNITYTDSYQESNSNDKDFRFLADAKKEASYDLKSYTQVFDNKHGFINNLSILDLLFHEGTNALNYLESQAITLNRE